MGKPDQKKTDDAVSLHTNPGESSRAAYIDDDVLDIPQVDIDDLPPNYSESESLLPPLDVETATAAGGLLLSRKPFVENATTFEDPDTGAQYWMAKSLEDPVNLEKHIQYLAAIPPRPYIRLVGTHTETTRDSKGKMEKNTITDFDVSVELTPYLYSDAQYQRSWSCLRTVENSETARRGTILKKRAPGSNQSIELGGTPQPTLQEWCHRYSASHAGLKVFTLQRRICGFDAEGVKTKLRELVYSTNYRGHLNVQLVVKDSLIECYNESWINKWRLTKWIRMLFMVTLLFIFTWPYLWLRTKRWEVAISDWHFSRILDNGTKEYVSVSEDQWFNMWGRAIHKAVLRKRQGLLDQNDLARAQEPEPAFDSGNVAVNGAVNLFRAGISAMDEVNRQLGWGGDC
ncbi:uncharacterized protein F4812DRAFT_297019 [Daldinia caldariorum]|uniref:uncharacterized protein n=1 Tax=Daldinia caldariorum TaxID=326644 RepID=UPI00200761AC|nr:uncharacterized protein F4812DRAFT_297019 [Daldinia caldariorum]KAI1469638.1 hypothetical protein F4812DRAFT_297019 [Daldinia caldariorum]